MKLPALFVALVMAAPVEAATIMVGGPGFGDAVYLDPADFSGSEPCGSGQSVVDDGCSVVLKNDPDAFHAFGRFNPRGGSWIDSQDMAEVTWTFSLDNAFRSLTFALTDARDQDSSFFELLVGDAEWSINTRQGDGGLHWLTINFDQPTRSAELLFKTTLNDGWGILSASVATVPLPGTVWLLLAALGGLGTVAHRKRLSA